MENAQGTIMENVEQQETPADDAGRPGNASPLEIQTDDTKG